jgi:sugar phosphate permease
MNIMNTTIFMPWLMWALPTSFFAYQFMMRIIPGLIMPELIQKFQIDATAYGFFASIYYLGYAGMQIPLALLLDRYSPKIIISLCVFLCAFGTISLLYTDNWSIALFSRFVTGASSATAFLGTSKLVSLWFPAHLYSRMIALNCTFGLIGAIYGGKPMSILISTFGWQESLLFMSLVGFAMAFSFFLLIKSPKNIEAKSENSSSIVKNLKTVLCDRRLIIIAIANLLMVGALEGFADVWGISYLMSAREMSKNDAALITSTVFFGMLFGGPFLAYVANKVKSYYPVISSCGFLISITFTIVLLFNANLGETTLYGLLFLVGILCCYQVLVFSMGASLVSPALAGITVAFLNCVNMLGGSFFHTTIGYVLDLSWSGQVENSSKIYDVQSYTYALSIIPIAAFIGGILFILANYREKQSIQRPPLSFQTS